MNPDDLAKILDELGQRLGPTGQHVFELAIRQVIINGIEALGIAVISAACIVLTLRFVKRFAAKEDARAESDHYHTSDAVIGYFVGGIAVLIFGISFVWAMSYALSNLLNPEYAAISDIVGKVTGAK